MIAQNPLNETLAAYLQAPAAAPLLDMNFGFARARVLDTALELRIFTYIAGGIGTCSLLATVAGCADHSLQRLLDALVGLDLLEYRHATYTLRPLAMAYLVEGQPGYLGAHLRAVIEQWDTWSELTSVVRSGNKHLYRNWGSSEGRERQPGMFAQVLPLAFPLAWQAAGQFAQPLRGRVLDLFAGSGAWGIALALRHPQVEVIACDEPLLLETVRENVQQAGLEGRFRIQTREDGQGSFELESFNLIIVSHACRFLGAHRSQQILKECYRLLQPGGQLLLVDVISETRTGPSAALVIQLSLFLNTEEGDVFSLTQFHTWLKAAGFEDIKDQRIGTIPLLLATR